MGLLKSFKSWLGNPGVGAALNRCYHGYEAFEVVLVVVLEETVVWCGGGPRIIRLWRRDRFVMMVDFWTLSSQREAAQREGER